MDGRLAVAWGTLLGVGQLLDVATTGIDRGRGAVESVPATAAVLVAGGLTRLALLKLLLVIAAAVALAITLRWGRRRAEAMVVHRFVLNACRILAVVVLLVSLNNAVLLGTLSG